MNSNPVFLPLLLGGAILLTACGGGSGGSSKQGLIKDVRAYRDNSQCNSLTNAPAAESRPIAGLNLDDLTDLDEDDLQDLFDDLLNDLDRDVTNYLDSIDLSEYEAEYEEARREVENAAQFITNLKNSSNRNPYPSTNFPGETWLEFADIPNENLSDRLRLRVNEKLESGRVEIGLAVTDELGLAISDLSPDQVIIEGLNALGEAIQEFDSFRFSNVLADLASQLEQLSVSAVNDYSGSMSQELEEVEFSLDGFYRFYPDRAQTEIVKFNDETFVFFPMATASGTDLNKAIKRRPSLTMTAMYDAVTTGIVSLCQQSGYRAVLLLTDGQDNSSSVTLDETIAFARTNDVPVFVIGFGYANKYDLKRITEETGGAYLYFPYEVYEQMMVTQGKKPWDLGYSLMANLYVYDYLIELADVLPEVVSIRVSVRQDSSFKSANLPL